MFSLTEIAFICVMAKHNSTANCRRFEGTGCLSLHGEIHFNSNEISTLPGCYAVSTGKLLTDVRQGRNVFIFRVTFLCLID